MITPKNIAAGFMIAAFVALAFALLAGCATAPVKPRADVVAVTGAVDRTAASVTRAQGGVAGARTNAQRIDAKAAVLLRIIR